MNRVRHPNQRLRAKLPHIGTKSAKRLLKQRRRKETRFAADPNHRIAKRISTEAERAERGIGTAPDCPGRSALSRDIDRCRVLTPTTSATRREHIVRSKLGITRLGRIAKLALAIAAIGIALVGTAGLARAASTKSSCTTGSVADRAICHAHEQREKPYVWGGKGPQNFDCSGLTHYVYAKAGLKWSYYTAEGQYNYGRTKHWTVSTKDLRPGDLLFFDWNGGEIDHVGIYIGGNQMIEASSSSGKVKVTPLSLFHKQHMKSSAVRPAGAPNAKSTETKSPSPKSTNTERPSPKPTKSAPPSPKPTKTVRPSPKPTAVDGFANETVMIYQVG
ncbi:NlpC/P60 family protein [Dactylosporangium sp. NPDC000555]|uniref:C40 family peptidase n=1 Tax=Dactylosporangium sp. NPDC000555 TaxID=3154260 RepID=UPI0033202BA3